MGGYTRSCCGDGDQHWKNCTRRLFFSNLGKFMSNMPYDIPFDATDSFRRNNVEPADILSAAKTLSTSQVHTCGFLDEDWSGGKRWVSAETYYKWAEECLSIKDAHGLDSALSYAKRSSCRRIDGLLRYNHLVSLDWAKFPVKIERLRQLGIDIPDVVQGLVIDPRNETEHGYRRVEGHEAKNAVDIAKLLMLATQGHYQRNSIIALQWNVIFEDYSDHESSYFQVTGFASSPMLLIDVFRCPIEVKIVRPADNELDVARLDQFTVPESIDLASLLRHHYAQRLPGKCSRHYRPDVYKVLLDQSGI